MIQKDSSRSKKQVETSENIALTIDIKDPYEDDDYEIHFDRKQLLDHLQHLEDDNLFRISLL
jgi:hypothetical protein